MNKKLLILLVLALLIFFPYCAYSQDKQDNGSIIILRYNNIINNMKVEIIWKPNPNESRCGYIIGPGIIEFTNVKYGESFTIVNNNIGILEKRLTGLLELNKKESGYSFKRIPKDIRLDYKKPKLNSGSNTFEDAANELFFFYDIDFDNENELIISEACNGQRFRSTFKVYKLTKDLTKDMYIKEQDLYQITYNEPYIYLDTASAINKSNKTIEIDVSAGALYSESKIYKLDSEKDDFGNNKYKLEKIIKNK